jgi:hypothetical protein
VYVTDAHEGAFVKNTETSSPVVDKFSARGEYIGQITRNPDGEPFSEEGFLQVFGVAVDSHGQVWVAEENHNDIKGAADYTSAVANVWIGFRRIYKGFFGQKGEVPSFAVDSEDNLYTNIGFRLEEERLVESNIKGELIREEIDGEEPTGAAVELSSNDVYVSHYTNVHRLDASDKSLETLPVPGGHGSGVAVDSATLTVYVADSAAGEVDVYGPEAPGVPTVSVGSESVKDVTATSASFSAEVNPRSEPNEEATSYSFVYGPCYTPTTCKSSPYVDSTPAPEGHLTANYEPDLLSAHPQDLLAHTAYHMRLVAHNSHPGVAEGEEIIFTTQAAGSFTLPDGRSWEMVSPPNKYGALIQALPFPRLSQTSDAGGAITYYANSPIEAQSPGNSGSIVQVLARRTSTGWLSHNIAAPHETAPSSVTSTEYPFFSQDLEFGLLQPAGAFISSLSPEASEQTPFLRSNFPSGDPAEICTSSCYTPLVTGVSGIEDVPSGTVFGLNGLGKECFAGECGPEFVGASPDARHIVMQYRFAPLVEGAPLGSLYEWTAGQLSVVSILPNHQLAASGTLGTAGNSNVRISRNTVSADGSRLVWSSGEHLYLRDTVKNKTVELDAVQGGSGHVAGPLFQTASSDGSRIFFTDSQQLTADSGASAGSVDLYECEMVEEAGALKCLLSDLTGGSNEPGSVVGIVPGASEDGSYVYFVDTGALTDTQINERGEKAVVGQPNLYVRHAGKTNLIAVLSGDDSKDFAGGSSNLAGLTARVSPNGHWFSFMSDRSLTGFNNHDAVSGEPDEEIFLYHAVENDGERLVCASCNPTGARPDGVKDNPLIELGPGSSTFERRLWIAAMLPGWTSPFYQSRYLGDSGRLFFDSLDALAPQDINGAEDVYQFEPSGSGDCTKSSTTFVVASSGCVGLISSGTSREGSAFLDASDSGDDVFFLTTAQLSPLDIDSTIDIYDAHECGAGEDCSPPASVPVPACEGDACQSPATAPEDPTPGSLTYQGPGNPLTAVAGTKTKPKSKPTKCRKGFIKRHGKCVKKKPKKRVKAKRSNRRIG